MATKAKAQPETNVTKAEVIEPLAVSITFQGITNLKLPIALDDKGHLVVGGQFQAKLDPFEVFRLVNLLNQPNGGLSATITSPQAAMDFHFDPKTKTVEVLQAVVPKLIEAKVTEKKKGVDYEIDDKGTPCQILSKKAAADVLVEKPEDLIKILGVTFNHIPKEKLPYGVMIEYVNRAGEIKSGAGRGKSPTEAVILGVHHCGLSVDLKEPFEIRAALEKLEASPDGYKLIRVRDVGSFDDKGAEETGGG